MAATVTRRGGTPMVVSNANDVRAVVTCSPPDLILLDLDLPDADALNLLVELKTSWRTRSIPVVATSAFEDHDLVAVCAGLGAEGYFAGPGRSSWLGRLLAGLEIGMVGVGAAERELPASTSHIYVASPRWNRYVC